jgi:predicted Rossmann fold nucleotide-binding protein DprA/Smf involved in DNA uptake
MDVFFPWNDAEARSAAESEDGNGQEAGTTPGQLSPPQTPEEAAAARVDDIAADVEALAETTGVPVEQVLAAVERQVDDEG